MLVKNDKSGLVLYFDEYVETYSESEYINVLLKKFYLDGIGFYYANRYVDDVKLVDGLDIKIVLFKESLDHYVAKKISIDNNFINGDLFKNYIRHIGNIAKSDPTEYITNIVFHDDEIKEKIFEKYFTDQVPLLKKSEENTASRFKYIFDKIEKEEDVTQEEIDFVSSFLARMKFDIDDASNLLLKYIFGKMRNTELNFSYPVQEFVLSRLPFIYSTYSLAGCRIDIATHSRAEAVSGAGRSNDKFKNCLINRGEYKNISLKSINDSKEHRKAKGTDFTHFMIVAFHELTHQYQNLKSKEDALNDIGVSKVIAQCLRKYLNDYTALGNHDNSPLEIDADKYGWIESLFFYQRYLSGDDKEELIENCKKNIQTATDRRALACKCNPKTLNYMLYDDYDVMNLYALINKHHEILNKYPMLNHVFKYSYQTHKCSFNMDVLFENNFDKENIMEFIDYYFVFNKRDELIKCIKENPPDMSKIVFLLSNFVQFVEMQHDAPNQIDDIVKRNNLGDTTQKNFFDNKLIETIKNIRIKKYNVALSETLKLLKELTYTYPQLNDYFANVFNQLKIDSGKTEQDFFEIVKKI